MTERTAEITALAENNGSRSTGKITDGKGFKTSKTHTPPLHSKPAAQDKLGFLALVPLADRPQVAHHPRIYLG